MGRNPEERFLESKATGFARIIRGRLDWGTRRAPAPPPPHRTGRSSLLSP